MSLHRFLAARAVACLLALAFCMAPPAALAAGLNADFITQVQGTYTGANPLGSVGFSFNQRSHAQVTSGTSVGQADKLFSDSRTIAASSSGNLDLAGALADPFGSIVTFGHVKAIYVKAAAANANGLVVGGAAANGFVGPFGAASDTITVPPGGTVLLVHPGAGWAVTAGTGDLLQVANAGGGSAVSYDILIAGTSN